MGLGHEAFEFISSHLLATVFIASLAMMRPLGMLLGFIAIVWVIPPISLIRTGIAFALSIPIVAYEASALTQFVQSTEQLVLSITFIKEIVIGYAIGLLASLPFWVMQFAGSTIDSYRGEFNPSHQDPTGGQMQTISKFYLIVAFLIFVSGGGFWSLTEVLYKSFGVWPITTLLPTFSSATPALMLGLFDNLVAVGIVTAAPLLFTMIAIDFTMLVGGKIAKGFNPMDVSFIMKNLLTVITLPLIALMLVQTLEENLFRNLDIIAILRSILP